MKLIHLVFFFTALSIMGCNNDDDQNTDPLDDFALSYDGINQTSPNLPPAQYEAAAQFFASDLTQYQGRDLAEVSWYFTSTPNTTVLKIYKGSNGNAPDRLVYQVELSSQVSAPSWNVLELPEPIEITDEDLWIGISFTLNGVQQSIGCDSGPNQTGGDWLYSTEDNSWRSFRDRTGEGINWNIRGAISN